LANHLKYFIEQLDEGTNGKNSTLFRRNLVGKLTMIGSKANDATIQKISSSDERLPRKIKEQTMNIV
jgi:uncharacterized protein YicC (UPF0701 family)